MIGSASKPPSSTSRSTARGRNREGWRSSPRAASATWPTKARKATTCPPPATTRWPTCPSTLRLGRGSGVCVAPACTCSIRPSARGGHPRSAGIARCALSHRCSTQAPALSRATSWEPSSTVGDGSAAGAAARSPSVAIAPRPAPVHAPPTSQTPACAGFRKAAFGAVGRSATGVTVGCMARRAVGCRSRWHEAMASGARERPGHCGWVAECRPPERPSVG